MQPLGLNEIREKFLEFFEQKQHLRLKSFPLIPHNDKSLLIINSGMAPLKPYFTGQEIPPKKRVTTCQKCVRTGDIENVGKNMRHGTFFEMLGNFSFGDYFKEEIIPWAWEFITEVMEIPAERLFVSVYEEDGEAYDIWRNKVGLPAEKIVRLGKDDNFWEVGTGPCGPCSEIHFDRGEKHGCGKPDCAVGCDCDRFMEIWNLVFTQFNKEEDDSYSKLKSTNIDTGMGLERISMIMQEAASIFDVDTIKMIREAVCTKAGVTYGADTKTDISVRIITDHVRSVTFMAADGILPSNEGRGYVLRRLLRRAALRLKMLGIKGTYLSELSSVAIEASKGAYPELSEKSDYIRKLITVEENRFFETLDSGMEVLKTYTETIQKQNRQTLFGGEAFKLYDTYGFPVELLQEILEEKGLSVDMPAFYEEMEKQRKRGRESREESTYMGADETVYNRLDPALTTLFTGYLETYTDGAVIKAVIVGNDIADEANTGDEVSIILDKTVVYAESGGQKGDSGLIKTQSGEVLVKDCVKVSGNKFAHIGVVTQGTIKTGQSANVSCDAEKRLDTARNHSATHLLQKALREVLGVHIEQAGSYVTNERLRFDFTHFAAMTRDELNRVENIVNDKILEGLTIETKEMPVAEAKNSGATALFGEKYGDTVRVVNMSGYSIELCGGTHLTNTAQIGSFKLLSESGVAAGVRRIEALTGRNALSYYKDTESQIAAVGVLVKAAPDNLLKRVEQLVLQTKELQKELDKARSGKAADIVSEILNNKQDINGITVIVSEVAGTDAQELREMGDKLKSIVKSGVFVLIGEKDGKVSLLAMATDDAVKAGINCGNIIKQAAAAAGGGGGGRPNMAQAGAKDVAKIGDALKIAGEIIKTSLNG